jgi:hypothetical protein
MSGAQPSAWMTPNDLLDMQAYQMRPERFAIEKQNALLQQQETQQGIDARDQEMVARASSYLLTLPEDQREAAYPGIVQNLQAGGFAKRAPSQYPGHQTIAQLAAMGTPSADQFKLGANARAKAGMLPGDTTVAAPGPAPQPGAPGTGAPATTVAAPSGDIEPEAVTRANAVRDGLMKRGMDPETATAFAANALHESSAKPDTGAGDGGRSHGLFQWNADRLAAYQAKFGHAPDNAPLDEQLDFVMHELGGSESLARGRIASAQGVAGKAAQVSEAYLRPKDTVAEMQRRSATALRLAQLGLPAPASEQPTSDTAWLDNQARMYPGLAGPNAPAQPPAGGPGAPGRVQVASVTPTGPGGAPTATDATPAAAAPPAAAAQPDLPPLPPLPQLEPRNNDGFTASQMKRLRDAQRDPNVTSEEFGKLRDAYLKGNDAEQQKAQTDTLAILKELRERKAQADLATSRTATQQRETDAAVRQAEDHALRMRGPLREGYRWSGTDPTQQEFVPGGPADPVVLAAQAKARGEGGRPLPSVDRQKLIGHAGMIDELGQLDATFAPGFGGSRVGFVGDTQNWIARNTSIGNVPAAEWWSQYQRQKIASRQVISGQSLTASEKSEYDKADINPGMTDDVIRQNLAVQQRLLKTARDRTVRSMAADGYNAKALEEASGINPDDTKSVKSADYANKPLDARTPQLPAGIPPADKRPPGRYLTPQGPMNWTGTGWVPAGRPAVPNS